MPGTSAVCVYRIKAVKMAVVAAIGITVGFAFLRGAVRRAAMQSGRKKNPYDQEEHP